MSIYALSLSLLYLILFCESINLVLRAVIHLVFMNDLCFLVAALPEKWLLNEHVLVHEFLFR